MSENKKRSILALVVGVLVFGFATSAMADRILAIELEPDYTYQDTNMACTKNGRYQLFFSARVTDDGKIAEGRLHQSRFVSFPKSIQLLTEELKGIEIAKDGVDEYWVKQFPMSARLLNWLIFNIAGIELNGPGVCRPKTSLKTLTPYGHTFVFRVKSATEYTTGKVRFSGERVDGEPYNIKLGFMQRPAKD